ncbi:MAG: Gfo/Idh/MocA family oxidoreductase [Chloroflexi bacterium]|nr:MAG: Gfo/Idh/MocA family oxidoreductase [Chloroflexota bacterium]
MRLLAQPRTGVWGHGIRLGVALLRLDPPALRRARAIRDRERAQAGVARRDQRRPGSRRPHVRRRAAGDVPAVGHRRGAQAQVVPARHAGRDRRRLGRRGRAGRSAGAGNRVHARGGGAPVPARARRAWLLPQPGRPPRVGRAARGPARGGEAERGHHGGGDAIAEARRRAADGGHIATRRLGWGILGAANIARRAVLAAIAESDNGRLVAMASRSAERARQMLEPHPGVRIVDSYDALLADPEVDAVYNPLPNSLHREWTVRALEAGKHVLCEKPIGLNAAEAEEMAAAAERAGRHLMEAFMYRFHPAMREFVEGVRDPIHVQATFGFTAKHDGDIRLQPNLGGGALLDVGCYTVSVSRWILGEPVEVAARGRFEHDVDVSIASLLTFPGATTSSVWASLESPEEQALKVVTRAGVLTRVKPFSAYRDPHDPYRLMVESFGDSVLHDRPVAIPLSESIANMRVLDRIAEAARP